MQIKQYFLEREDPLEQDDYERLYSVVSERIPSDRLRLLTKVSFIMLKPNAYVSGQMPGLLDELRDDGVYIFAHQFKTLDAQEIDELYKFVKIKYWSSWWVMPRLYKLAPCFIAIVVGDPGKFPHLSARIREIVGPTTPIRGTEANLRYRLRNPHRVFNSIHATDDPASAVREALVFFGLDDIERALDSVASGKFIEDTSIDKSALAPEKPQELNYGLAKSDIKRHLYSLVTNILSDEAYEAGPYGRLRGLVTRLGEMLESERAVLEMRLPLREEFERLRTILMMQRLTIGLIAQELTSAAAGLFRDDVVAGTPNEDIAKGLSEAIDLIELAHPMTDEVLLMETGDFEAYMGRLMRTGLKFDKYTEVMLLAGWAASDNEWTDIALKMKL